MADAGQLYNAMLNARRSGNEQDAQILERALRKTVEADPDAAGFLSQAIGGLTFGLDDEIAGFVAGASGDEAGGFAERYEQARDLNRAQDYVYRSDNPVAALGGEALGALATGGAGLLRSAGAKGLGALARQGAGYGAAGGAAAGAGFSEAPTVEGVLADTAQGAALGGVLGSVLAPAAEGGALAYQGVRRRISGRSGANDVLEALRSQSATPDAPLEQIVEGAAERLEEVPGSVVADLGAETRGLLSANVAAPGRTAEAATEQLTQRSAQQADEVQALFGQGRVQDMIDERKRVRQGQAGPMYARAYQQPTDMTPELRRIWERSPILRDVWNSQGFRREAAETAYDEGLPPLDPRLLGDAEPSTMGWDHLVRHLGREYERLRLSDPSRARLMAREKDRVLDEVSVANPALAEARRTYAGHSAQMEAAREGEKFMSLSAEDVDRLARDFSQDQRDAFMEGVASSVRKRLGSDTGTHDVTKHFRRRDTQEKLRTVLGEQRFEELMGRINELHEQQITMNMALGNSATAQRLARQQAQRDDVAGAAIELAVSPGALFSFENLARQGAQRLAGVGQQERRNLAGQILLSGDPDRVRGLLTEAMGPSPGAPPALIEALRRGTPGSAGVLGSYTAER